MTQEERRQAAALAAAALIVLSAAAALIFPLMHWLRRELDERNLYVRQIAALRGVIAVEAGNRDMLHRIDSHPLWQRLYRDSAAQPATGELQKDVRALAEQAGLSIESMQPLPQEQNAAYLRIGVKLTLNAQIDSLGKWLIAMDASPHFLQFENFYISAPLTQEDDHNAVLSVSGEITAFAIPNQGAQ